MQKCIYDTLDTQRKEGTMVVKVLSWHKNVFGEVGYTSHGKPDKPSDKLQTEKKKV